MNTMITAPTRPLIEAPASDVSRTYETLGYVEAYDAVLNCDYAFVAYKETDRSSGEWRVCIRSSQTAGGSFEPGAIRLKAREAGARERPFFNWGYNFEPTPADPRQIEFRVYQQEGLPSEVEIYVVMRKANGSAAAPKSVKFAWPA